MTETRNPFFTWLGAQTPYHLLDRQDIPDPRAHSGVCETMRGVGAGCSVDHVQMLAREMSVCCPFVEHTFAAEYYHLAHEGCHTFAVSEAVNFLDLWLVEASLAYFQHRLDQVRDPGATA